MTQINQPELKISHLRSTDCMHGKDLGRSQDTKEHS